MILSTSSVVILMTSLLALIGALCFALKKLRPKAWSKFSRAASFWATSLGASSNRSSPKLGSLSKQLSNIKVKSSNCSPKLKQVHFADAVSINPMVEYTSPNGKSKQNDASSANLLNRKTANNKHGVKSSEIQSGSEAKSHSTDATSHNNNCILGQSLSREPSSDEMDSSILLEVFNPTKTGMNIATKRNKQTQRHVKSNNRKRHSSDSNQTSYSSEQLFKMIAASSLSRDEVEMAVETLLIKLESGETEWQKPKSDPLLRLRSQLRESEAALTTEIQNHEQTRARLAELKAQLQSERSRRGSAGEELARVKSELLTTSLALERARCELSRQQTMHENALNESSNMISKLEEENSRLQNILANSNVHHDELNKLRHELNESVEQLHRYEAANENLKVQLHELENTLRAADVRLDQLRADKQHDNYEACTKISGLESDRVALEKALKDHMVRLNEVSETNKKLESSLNESRLSCAHKEELIKHLNEEKHINETVMKRTLFEMEQELRKLHERLGSRTASNDEKFRQELNQFERELTNAGEREQKLKMDVKQLREGLSELFPELKSTTMDHSTNDDWIHHYLIALKKLSATVDELRQPNGNRYQENGNNHFMDSPSNRSKSGLSGTNGKSLSRLGSPVCNGRSSRASNRDRDKRIMENKLLEDMALFCLRCLD